MIGRSDPLETLGIGRWVASGAPEGFDALAIAQFATRRATPVIHIARDAARMAELEDALGFFAPDISVLSFPAWDCLPYDRVSPSVDVVSQRVACLSALAERVDTEPSPSILLTTVSAALQRVPPRAALATGTFSIRTGESLDVAALQSFLEHNGYHRTGTVRETGEFALRGGILDLFPAGAHDPLRVDLFGDQVESLKRFDPMSQRSAEAVDQLILRPAGEVTLDRDSIARFRTRYLQAFGAVRGEDPLYEAVSAGRRSGGIEHWLPFFHDRLETLFDYLPGAAVMLDHFVEDAVTARQDLIADHYAARLAFLDKRDDGGGAPYKPVNPELLYIDTETFAALASERTVVEFAPYDAPDGASSESQIDLAARPGRDFAEARKRPDISLFEELGQHIGSEQQAGRRVLIACYSTGSRERLAGLMHDGGLEATAEVDRLTQLEGLEAGMVGLAVLPIQRGFCTNSLSVITEQDILGDRLVRRQQKRRGSEQFIAEASQLSVGDLVTHVDHGIGRFNGLVTIEVTGAPHDCLRLIYAGDDKLFVPVENLEVLSRFGSEDMGVPLDRLGQGQWQARKAKVKERIREIAQDLLRVAAARTLRKGDVLAPTAGIYDEFSARFPYQETDDQHRAIDDVVGDLSSGQPMDRLICGDVGFGKTEVALRAAFLAVANNAQVAVVVPTTLLARQHYQTFRERFETLPVQIAQLSRLVKPKDLKAAKQGAADGTVDILIGTHALLSKSIGFKRLGLLIVDEEQHFGVAQKERLKQLRSEVHVLTMTATPIPRTLQLALSGVRDLSIIATPPVDRLAVRTFVLPFDPVIVREAILRERFRGGQVFYVCPRVKDLPEVTEQLQELVPEVRIAVAHGQLPADTLEEVMSAFIDGQYDVLVSTNIVESGLDIPNANTMVIHRADMFGLAQLYQLRGRIGRSKTRAYAYLTLPPKRRPTKNAIKRLEVMQTLDTLGAGFQLASYDLDIRGAGNLLGDEQSGHIREVGIELYQQMLEDAIQSAKAGVHGQEAEDDELWTPQITLGSSVLIPEEYVPDLDVRLSLYRRMANLESAEEVESFAAELIDRFGSLPTEVENLVQIIVIKQLCRAAGVDKVDAGPRGALIGFRNDRFANPAGLVTYMQRRAGAVKLRPDHKLVYMRGWTDPAKRVAGVKQLLSELVELSRVDEAA